MIAVGHLDIAAADRLAKVCGLFGSDSAGERSAAAWKAHELLESLGLDWRDVIRPTGNNPSESAGRHSDRSYNWGQNLMLAWRYPQDLRPWEQAFVSSMLAWESPTPKQRAVIAEIAGRLRARGRK